MVSKTLQVSWAGCAESQPVRVGVGSEQWQVEELIAAVNALRGLPPVYPVVFRVDGAVLGPRLVLTDASVLEVSVERGPTALQRDSQPASLSGAGVSGRRASGKLGAGGGPPKQSPTFLAATLRAGVWKAALAPLARSRSLNGA